MEKPAEQFRVNLLTQAKDFLSEMAGDSGTALSPEDAKSRWQSIEEDIHSKGTYVHTQEELAFGAKLAWRNSNRCIGRHMWRSLNVIDARNIRDRQGVIDALGKQMVTAWNGGNIESVITVFAPRHPEDLSAPDPVRLANHQLMRYAGFVDSEGQVMGDPASVSITQEFLAKGWKPRKQTPFTPLPWSVWIDDQETPLYDAFGEHPEWLKEVPLTHPELPAFADLGIKWYAIPAISEMALVVGGIVYPCAPFSGWYMETEIGARDLGDKSRYDLLPTMADLLGLDRSSPRSLWKDRAMVELNRAVLHSFDQAGARIGDHHELGAQFEKFCSFQEKKGMETTGDWSWLNSPLSSSSTPQFHRSFKNEVTQHTNYFYQSHPQVDAQARKDPSVSPGIPHPDPFHLGHKHPTPRCPFGFDQK